MLMVQLKQDHSYNKSNRKTMVASKKNIRVIRIRFVEMIIVNLGIL